MSEPQKFELCVDLSICEGVCLVSHPPFSVTVDPKLGCEYLFWS